MFDPTYYIDWRLYHLDKTNSRNAQIKKTFNQTLRLYPTKNLEDFYDKEGFRDQEFEKAIKALGSFILK